MSVSSLINWENGVHPVPFYAYLALLLVSESQHYKLASYDWRDWRFIERGNTDSRQQYRGRESRITELVNPTLGAAFTPRQLENYHLLMQQAAAALSANVMLQAKVDELVQANTSLPRLFLTNGLTAELHAMRDRMEALVRRINTAEVVPFKKGRLVAKVAAG